ncbi:guanylate kinase [uncultured Eubacterium sp.]|uniref:guanylate kinase n=1 Tax=uncultured Eubacterium sp. TaxID=165185 RepID=UPI00259176D9|nr:guanylate kinase [uncultured Eubacterium sp.]
MGNIYCLMGKSASGKDTIYNRLLAMEKLHLRRVVPYTTRPMRSGETDGQTYFFCTEQQVEEFEAAGKIIELRAYHTVYGIWKYFTADDGQICLTESDYLMIGTLEAYEQIRDYFGAEKVCPVYVEVDDGLRLQRALDRERAQDQPKYAEMCRRFLADEEDFSEENLERAGITKRFQNTDLDQVTQEIASYMNAE